MQEKKSQIYKAEKLTQDDFSTKNSKGINRNYCISKAAISVLNVARNESNETINEFVSKAIIQYGLATLPMDKLDPLITEQKNDPRANNHLRRIAALEKVTASIGLKILKQLDKDELDRAIDFFSKATDITEKNTIHNKFKACEKHNEFFNTSSEFPLWLILIYADKYGLNK